MNVQSNADLDPEEGDTFTAGIVWRPESVRGLRTSVDYFNIEVANAIELLFPSVFIPLCFLTDGEEQFCSTFSRDESGNIDTARITWVNAAVVSSEGLDFTVDYRRTVERFGLFGEGATFALSVAATHYLEAGSQASPLAPFFDCAGKFGGLCEGFLYQGTMPDLRTVTRLTYSSGPLTASLRWSHIGEVQNSVNEFRESIGQPPGELAVPRVGAFDYFDLTLEGRVGERWRLRLGVDNLFDTQPPLIGSGSFAAANTDPRTYDILGRRFVFSLTASL